MENAAERNQRREQSRRNSWREQPRKQKYMPEKLQNLTTQPRTSRYEKIEDLQRITGDFVAAFGKMTTRLKEFQRKCSQF